jgi:hypothetical protein
MNPPSNHEVTLLLKAWSAGDEHALGNPWCATSYGARPGGTWRESALVIHCKPLR